MDTNLLLIILIAAIAVAVAAWFVLQQRKRTQLRERFGPEYDRAVLDTGDQRHAERELARREERVRSLELRPLPPEQRARFGDMWRRLQARFVDSPAAAIADADALVTEVMQARGYPVGDFDQRAADISVDHPDVVENYRAARAISERNRRGEASTEDLRQAMVHYRSLFEDLLGMHTGLEAEVKIERA